MFDHMWVRFVVASMLFGAYGLADLISRSVAGRARPLRVKRPRWSHFIGFASVLFFYEALARDGREVMGGAGNQLGVVLSLIAMLARFASFKGSRAVRHPDLTARLLFYASLPIVIGSPRSFILFTVAQIAIAIQEARQRDEATSTLPAADVSVAPEERPKHRIVPGFW